ncbi:hypothetical protein [Nocardioides jiangxiensis]|uniref:Trypsin-like peptidase domain-containing protein n=1 Tax=Nocardioides jiangxiensis TaxID=3064524 RepID=A0ABT9AXI1_9ACTN|nr:hypothetical protein [Nocardioides sp. WY-20]MDO7867259.1 hypothetical protein [Nocardioides sp. WY-20]
MTTARRIGPRGRVALTGLLLLAGPAVSACDTEVATGVSAQASSSASGQVASPLTRRSDRWASAGEAVLTPGVQAYTAGGGQCTTNFVFTDADARVYLGQAAHCGSTGESSDTNGCDTGSVELGTRVIFREHGTPLDEGKRLAAGTLVYSSWRAMQHDNEHNAATCAYNDFALIRIDSADAKQVNPSVPFWGGPTGIDTDGVAAGDPVYSYGNSSLRFGLTEFSRQQGTARSDDAAADGWSHSLVSPTPGVPGDSGSAYLSGPGLALGTLSTLGLSIPIINSVGDLGRELRYAQAHSGIAGLALELGTTPFNG